MPSGGFLGLEANGFLYRPGQGLEDATHAADMNGSWHPADIIYANGMIYAPVYHKRVYLQTCALGKNVGTSYHLTIQ